MIGAVLIVLLAWPSGQASLTGHINIVGNPTFTDFDYLPAFSEYRLIEYVFPVAVIVIYALLAWRGPLSGPREAADREQVPLTVLDDVQIGHGEQPAGSEPSALWRPIATASFVVLAASVASDGSFPEVGWGSVASGCIYVLVVVGVAWGLAAAKDGRLAAGARSVGRRVAVVNAVAVPVVAFGGLWFVSHHTEILLADGSAHRWSWLPWWLTAAAVVSAWWWLIRQLRLGRSVSTSEQRLRVVLIGSALMYVLIAQIATEVTGLQGFDDSQGLTGAFLLQHGYFPWRDFQFIHGFFPDVVESLIGFHVFGDTVWGSWAGIDLILVPLTWVGVYLLAVWGARRGSFVVIGALLLAASAHLGIDPRFIAFPLILILLGKAIESPRVRWVCVLTTALFVEAVVVPEADFQVLAVVPTIVAVDLVHRSPGKPLTATFRRTLCLVATGASLMIVWLGFLASQHALTGFVNWFVIFGPGHDAQGAVPHQEVGNFLSFTFKLMVALVVVTVLLAAWRFHRRRAWTPLMWVTLAAALNAGVYGEQALGRYDAPHVQYSVDVGLLLFVLVVASVLPAADRLVASALTPLRGIFQRATGLRQPITLAAIVAVVVLVPDVRASVLHVPGRTRAQVGPQTQPTVRVGYSAATSFGPGELADLTAVLDTYAPKDAPFFDMTNSPGYFYFLFAKRPATVFTNISQAIPEDAQTMLINDLRKTRPPLVAFNSASIGLPIWDGIENEVRHFEVSQYVLDGWKPLLETQGVLFLLRADLMSHRPPAPHLSVAPITTNLYDSQPECTGGDSANFLQSDSAGPSVTVRAFRVTPVAGSPSKRIVEFRLPRKTRMSSYELATLGSTSKIGTASLTLSDNISAPATSEIAAGALPVTGSRLAVRVGSCLQWHGYRGRTLYVTQQSGATITSLTLSEVRG